MSRNDHVGSKYTEGKGKNMVMCFHRKFSFFNALFDSVANYVSRCIS
jgi:hypothetical protein